MIRTIRLFFAVLIVSIGFTACEKEYSEESGVLGTGGGSQTGTAEFTLAGAPGACVTPVISGSYVAGAALDASNSIILIVDVTTIGTYVISTGTSNGVSFTGSGTFTITGSQIIVLTGTGTPTAAGAFTYNPGNNGCGFPITFTPGGSATVAVGTLDCVTAVLAGTYTQGIALTSTNTVTIPVNVTTAGSYNVTTTATNGVIFTGSGNLALGAQSIKLTGSGLPVNAGAVSIPVSLGTSSCNFSITFIAGAAPAQGTLDCATAILAGTYTQGVALTSSNTISIPVNVTVAGPYSITTTATNGVTFTGSGTLASGGQTILLTGSGTPANSGTVSIPVSLGTSTCSVDISFIAGSADFLKCSVDGSPITTFNTFLTGTLVPGDFGVEGQSATQDLQIAVTNINGGDITVGTYHNFSLTNQTIFCNDQIYNLSAPTQIWSDLASSSFTVNITSITATVVTGTFSGNLTDISGGGSTKVITNGTFSISY